MSDTMYWWRIVGYLVLIATDWNLRIRTAAANADTTKRPTFTLRATTNGRFDPDSFELLSNNVAKRFELPTSENYRYFDDDFGRNQGRRRTLFLDDDFFDEGRKRGSEDAVPNQTKRSLGDVSSEEPTQYPSSSSSVNGGRDARILDPPRVVTEISVQETVGGQTIKRKPTSDELRLVQTSFLEPQTDDENNKTTSGLEDLESFLKADTNFEDEDSYCSWCEEDDEDVSDMETILKDDGDDYERRHHHDNYQEKEEEERERDKEEEERDREKEEEPVERMDRESEPPKDPETGEKKPSDYRKFFHIENKNFSNVKEVKIVINESEGDPFDLNYFPFSSTTPAPESVELNATNTNETNVVKDEAALDNTTFSNEIDPARSATAHSNSTSVADAVLETIEASVIPSTTAAVPVTSPQTTTTTSSATIPAKVIELTTTGKASTTTTEKNIETTTNVVGKEQTTPSTEGSEAWLFKTSATAHNEYNRHHLTTPRTETTSRVEGSTQSTTDSSTPTTMLDTLSLIRETTTQTAATWTTEREPSSATTQNADLSRESQEPKLVTSDAGINGVESTTREAYTTPPTSTTTEDSTTAKGIFQLLSETVTTKNDISTTTSSTMETSTMPSKVKTTIVMESVESETKPPEIVTEQNGKPKTIINESHFHNVTMVIIEEISTSDEADATTPNSDVDTETETEASTEEVLISAKLPRASSTTSTTTSSSTTTTTTTTTTTAKTPALETEIVATELTPAQVEVIFNNKVPYNEDEVYKDFNSTSDESQYYKNQSSEYKKKCNFTDNFSLPVVSGKIFDAIANFTVKICQGKYALIVPSSACVRQQQNVVTITWTIWKDLNNSITLLLEDQGDFYMAKKIMTHFLEGEEMITRSSLISFVPETNSSSVSVAKMSNGAYIAFSNVNFLQKSPNNIGNLQSSKDRKFWHLEVASICLVSVVIAAVVLYIVALKTKAKITLMEKDELPQVTHC